MLIMSAAVSQSRYCKLSPILSMLKFMDPPVWKALLLHYVNNVICKHLINSSDKKAVINFGSISRTHKNSVSIVDEGMLV